MNDVELAAEREASRRRDRARWVGEILPRMLLGHEGAAGATRSELRQICMERYGSIQIHGETMTEEELEAVVDRAFQLRDEKHGRRLDPADVEGTEAPKHEPEVRIHPRGESRAPAKTEPEESEMPKAKAKKGPKLSPNELERLKAWIREQLPAWEGNTADLFRKMQDELEFEIGDTSFYYHVNRIRDEQASPNDPERRGEEEPEPVDAAAPESEPAPEHEVEEGGVPDLPSTYQVGNGRTIEVQVRDQGGRQAPPLRGRSGPAGRLYRAKGLAPDEDEEAT